MLMGNQIGVSYQGKKKIILITKADFVGKVVNSTVENPHVSKHNNGGTQTTLLSPSSFTAETDAQGAKTLGGSVVIITTTANGTIAQELFSFNIIEQIERKMGRIPVEGVANKVQWLKDNVDKVQADWYGYGSSVGGNKATFAGWNGNWVGNVVATGGTVSKLSLILATSNIQSDGFVHFLAYAEPSDGTTASTINTDFVELEIKLKETANLL